MLVASFINLPTYCLQLLGKCVGEPFKYIKIHHFKNYCYKCHCHGSQSFDYTTKLLNNLPK